jgi:hypothetical protein
MFRPRSVGSAIAALLTFTTVAQADPIAYSMYERTNSVYQIDLSTGVTTPVSGTPLGFAPLALTYSGDGLVALGRPSGSNNTQLYSFSSPGGTYTPIGTGLGIVGRANAAGLGYDPSTGALFALIPNRFDEAVLYQINPTTGLATRVTPLTTQNPYADGLAFDSSGRGVAADAIDPSGIGYNRYDVNASDGALTNPSPIDINPDPSGTNFGFANLAFDSTGQLWLLSSSGALFRVDPSLPGGVTAPVFLTDANGNRLNGGEWRGLAIPTPVSAASTPTPEPSSLLVWGIATLVGSRLHRRLWRTRKIDSAVAGHSSERTP